ncbi:MAG: S8 family serine peptidase [Limnospira sp.]
MSLPTDPLFKEQWWLLNTGQGVTNNPVQPGTPGIDLNVVPLWPTYTGRGVKVQVIDNGVDADHEDLARNYDKRIDQPENIGSGPLPEPGGDNSHGTNVAGAIAATRNGIGTVGIAYEATLASFKLTDSITSLESAVNFDVSSNSWGGSTHFELQENGNFKELPTPSSAINYAVTDGRDGLGTVFVWAGGNERDEVNNSLPEEERRGRNVNSGNDENNRHVIAVAAIDNNGVVADYSNPGAPLLVSAFGEDGSIVTTDRTGDVGKNPGSAPNLVNINYNNRFNGTSSATPMVSGVVALMLEANPNLGYRDVQEILAYSARQTDPTNRAQEEFNYSNDTWTFNGAIDWNGGGLHISHDYGFGLVDATAAVRLAETWEMQHTAANETVQEASLSLPSEGLEIPDNQPDNPRIQTFTISDGIDIDKIELDIEIEHGQFQDLVVTLTSPDGTESVLLDRVPYSTQTDDGDTGFKGDSLDYTLTSSRHWGETGAGVWTLSVSDNSDENDPENTGEDETSGNNIGQLLGATLRVYGDEITADDTYIYTNEFASFTDPDDFRKTLTDTDGGIDTINVAAITDRINLNLNPGEFSLLPGRNLTENFLPEQPLYLAENSEIENAFSGEGNDTIVGNDADNKLDGGRGEDELYGNEGDDTLVANGGDILEGGAGSDRYELDAHTAGGTMIDDAEGVNTIILENAMLPDFAKDDDGDDGDDGDENYLLEDIRGLAKLDDILFIDLNANGQIDFRNDITIFNFFDSEGSNFDRVGNFSGDQIVEFFDNLPADSQETGNLVFVPSAGEPLNGVQNFIFADEGTNLPLEGRDEGDLIAGNVLDNVLVGGGGNDELFADAGDDFLSGNGGNDYLEGDGGNDTLFGGQGDDELLGNEGVDRLSGDGGFDALFGGEGNDILSGGRDDDRLFGNEGDDRLFGDEGRDTLEGGTGNDNLDGGTGNDELRGARGSDTLAGGGGADSLFAGAGHDFYLLEAATAGGSLIEDDGGNDALVIQGAALAIGFNPGQIGVTRGGELNTELWVDLNADGIFNPSTDLQIIDFFNNLEPGTGFIETVGNLTGQNILQAFPVQGTTGPDQLIGTDNDDTFDGLSGDDTLYGNAGNDTLIGNSNDDNLQGDNPEFISESEGAVFRGTPVGNDSLFGGDGNDTMFGGAGDDTLDGGDGDEDFANYENALNGVFVDLNTGIASDGLDGTDTLIRIEGVYGSDRNDTLIGSAADEFLNALEGGADILQAGLGNDEYQLDAGISGGSQIFDEGGEDTLVIANFDEIYVDREGTTLILNFSSEDGNTPDETIQILNHYAADVGDEAGVGFIENFLDFNGEPLDF